MAVVFGAILTTFTACKKEELKQVTPATNEEEIAMIMNKSDNSVTENDVTADESTYSMAIASEGISTDYLVDETDMDVVQGPAGGGNERDHIRARSFIKCLNHLELSDKQKQALRESLAKYKACQESAVKRAREIYHNLVTEYRARYEKLHLAFKNGEISEEKYKHAVAELRMSFHKELRSLHLKEKLNEAFHNCFRHLLGNMESILTPRQWAAFKKCYLS